MKPVDKEMQSDKLDLGTIAATKKAGQHDFHPEGGRWRCDFCKIPMNDPKQTPLCPGKPLE